jgi:hypothetical protein
MDTPKLKVESVLPIIIIIAVIAVIFIFGKKLSQFLGDLFGTSHSSTASVTAAADAQNTKNQNGAEANGVSADSVALSKANTVHDILNTMYTSDVILHPFSSSTLSESDAQKLGNNIVSGSGLDIAKLVLAYGSRSLPCREGSASGILYHDSYGTLRDHVSKYVDPAHKYSGSNISIRTHVLSYIDKVTKDYLTA